MLKRILAKLGYVQSTPGDWREPEKEAPAASLRGGMNYDPDDEFTAMDKSVENPVVSFLEAVRDKKPWNRKHVTIREAHLFEGRVGADGKLLKDGQTIGKLVEADKGFNEKPYRIRRVEGSEVLGVLAEAERTILDHPKRASESARAKRKLAEALGENISLDADMIGGPYDPQQYTEYTPIMGGPHFKQLYLTDYLTMHARAFEAWNHNPLAKRMVTLPVQYALGRGYDANSKREDVKKAWDEYERKHGVEDKLMRFWLHECLVGGELMIDREKVQSIDPSTVWDIICDPDNIDEVYYYHQQYPTAYFQFTGKSVPGVPGSAQTKPIEYIIRQIPYDKVLHIKLDCWSNEKRGRSWLFPILGWLKRVKDLYNASVIRSWLQASFIFDDTIIGSQADIDAHVAKYAQMPSPGSTFAHNESVKRVGIPGAAAGHTVDATAQEIIAFIGMCRGIPKEHLNLLGSVGSRATAMVASEPFTKVIEEVQSVALKILNGLAKDAMFEAGIKDFKEADLEFIFPSVAKDTTSEAVKNVMAGEASGYISKQTSATMYAAEMSISTYDFDAEQELIKKEKEQGLQDMASGQMLPDPRMPEPKPPEVEPDQLSPIHGQGANNVKQDLKTL